MVRKRIKNSIAKSYKLELFIQKFLEIVSRSGIPKIAPKRPNGSNVATKVNRKRSTLNEAPPYKFWTDGPRHECRTSAVEENASDFMFE